MKNETAHTTRNERASEQPLSIRNPIIVSVKQSPKTPVIARPNYITHVETSHAVPRKAAPRSSRAFRALISGVNRPLPRIGVCVRALTGNRYFRYNIEPAPLLQPPPEKKGMLLLLPSAQDRLVAGHTRTLHRRVYIYTYRTYTPAQPLLVLIRAARAPAHTHIETEERALVVAFSLVRCCRSAARVRYLPSLIRSLAFRCTYAYEPP